MSHLCKDCPFRNKSTGFVGGEGPADAEVMICGEAPGKYEVAKGEPFIGPAGAELNSWLAIAGIRRSSIYITNAVKCLPNDRTPSLTQIKECAERYLFAEVAEHSFKYIVALGSIASTVFGMPKARKGSPAHGFVLKRDSHYLMSTWHPAYALRSQYVTRGDQTITVRAEAQHDMMKFAQFIQGTLPYELPPDWMADPEEGLQALQDPTQTVAIDIETQTLNKFQNYPNLLGMAWRTPTGIRMASKAFLYQDLKALSGPAMKVFHNVNFDVGVLTHSAQASISTPFSCTQMVGALLASDMPRGLEFIARAYLNTAPWKWMSESDVRVYNAIDCWTTLRCWEEFTKHGGLLDKFQLRRVFERSQEALELSVDAHLKGIRVDVVRMNALKHIMEKHAVQAEMNLDRLVKEECKISYVNWNSPQQVMEILYDKLNLPKQYTTDQKTKQRRLTSDADALETLSELHPIPRLLRQFKTFRKLSSTYLEESNLHNNRVYPEFLLDTTSTGRFSSRSPNLQNQPKEGPIRSIYLPDDEQHYFVEVDFSQIEMRVMVHLSGEPDLVEAYEKGYDIHTTVAREVFGHDPTSQERHMAKFIVYGLSYGRGAASVAQQYGWDVPHAKEFVAAFSKRFPILWEWRREQVRTATNNRCLINPYGRRRYFYGQEFTTKAYNFIPQSTALDILIDGMIKLRHKCSWWRQMAWVHDSYCLSIPKKDMKEALTYIPELLRNCAAEFPTPVDVKFGERWGVWLDESVLD